VISSHDHVIIKSPIGSGKTLSYILPALQIVRNAIVSERDTQRPGFRLLILTASRERAVELENLVNDIARVWGVSELTARAVIGGRNLEKEIDYLDFKEPEVIIATMGRLIDHLPNSDYFRNLKVLVVDDAHKIMTMESKNVDTVLKELNKNRKTILVDDSRLDVSTIESKWFASEAIPEALQTIEFNDSKPKNVVNVSNILIISN
jgi:superfamily II DNA/RNA helicase